MPGDVDTITLSADGPPVDIAEVSTLLADLAQAGVELGDDPEQIADVLREWYAEPVEGELPTVDFTGRNAVTIMAEGGPYFGTGSPKGGSFFDEAYLKERADHTNEAIKAGELRSRLKLGHNEKQKILRESGLFGEDGKPAAGVLHNFRVIGKQGSKRLVADVKKVPKKLAALVKAGAWPGRSVELRNIEGTSATVKGKKWRVIDALSLLGEKAPAIRTLDDWLAYFGEDAADYEGADVQILLAEGDVVWKPDESYEAIRSRVSAALNPGPGMMSRYWVRDIADGKALVCESGDASRTWVVPFTRDDTGDVTVAASSDWTEAEQAWIETSSAYAERVAAFRAVSTQAGDPAADSSGVMPGTPTITKLSDEAVAKLATTFGIDEADDAKRREQVESKLAEVQGAVPSETPEGEGDETTPPAAAPVAEAAPAVEGSTSLSDAEVEVLKAQAKKGEQAFEDARVARRDTAIDKAITEGRLDPAKREKWQGFFDDNEATSIELLAELPVDEELRTVYGADESGAGADGQRAAERTLGDSWMAMSGVDDNDLYDRKAA